MSLTYDRPELVNKVVFRRNKETGGWEVSPVVVGSQASPSGGGTLQHRSLRVKPKVSCVTRDSVVIEDPDYTPVSGRGRKAKASSSCTTTPIFSPQVVENASRKRISPRFNNSCNALQVNHTHQHSSDSIDLHTRKKTVVNALDDSEDTPTRRSTRLRS